MIVSLLDPINLLCCNFTNQLFYAKTATPSLIEEGMFLMTKMKIFVLYVEVDTPERLALQSV